MDLLVAYLSVWIVLCTLRIHQAVSEGAKVVDIETYKDKLPTSMARAIDVGNLSLYVSMSTTLAPSDTA